MPAGQRRGLAKWLLIPAVIACGRFQRQAYIVGTQHPVADLKEGVVLGFCCHNALFDLSARGANEAFSSTEQTRFLSIFHVRSCDTTLC
jgi:hypothetical protein